MIQNVFTTAKTGSLIGLILAALLFGWNGAAVSDNFGNLWTVRPGADGTLPLAAAGAFGLLVALCVSQTGSLFSADAWNNITFTAGEVREPRRNDSNVPGPRHRDGDRAVSARQRRLSRDAHLRPDPARALGSRRHLDGRRDRAGRGRDDHGAGDHDLDLRLQQRADSGGRARVLRDGARRPVLPARRRPQRRPRPGLRAAAAGDLGDVPDSAADLRRVQPARTETCTATCSTT